MAEVRGEWERESEKERENEREKASLFLKVRQPLVVFISCLSPLRITAC